MFRKKNKVNISKIIIAQVVITLIGFLIIAAISFPLYNNFKKRQAVNNEIEELKNEISLVGNKNNELKKYINYLNSDEFINEEARLNLNYKKEGEELYVVKDNNVKEEFEDIIQKYKISGLGNRNAKQETNISRWIRYFFSS